MNNIQKALEMQEIYAGWNGPEPSNSMVITAVYMNSQIEGYPRMVRTVDDANNSINIELLKQDFDTVKTEVTENNRIVDIKRTAGEIIMAEYPEWKQRNLTARSIELVNKSMAEDLTIAEQEEIRVNDSIWSWISSVREVSDHAESAGTLPHLVEWPENN